MSGPSQETYVLIIMTCAVGWALKEELHAGTENPTGATPIFHPLTGFVDFVVVFVVLLLF